MEGRYKKQLRAVEWWRPRKSDQSLEKPSDKEYFCQGAGGEAATTTGETPSAALCSPRAVCAQLLSCSHLLCLGDTRHYCSGKIMSESTQLLCCIDLIPSSISCVQTSCFMKTCIGYVIRQWKETNMYWAPSGCQDQTRPAHTLSLLKGEWCLIQNGHLKNMSKIRALKLSGSLPQRSW